MHSLNIQWTNLIFPVFENLSVSISVLLNNSTHFSIAKYRLNAKYS